jgi:mono/diheme cytochrome c family protein
LSVVGRANQGGIAALPVIVGIALALAISLLVFISSIAYLNRNDHLVPSSKATGLVEKGKYLALVGNCAGCHSLLGGQPYAGGYAVPTPYGAIFAGNLTPDKQFGIGSWTTDDFWRAMHNGRSKDGRLLYPAFPYTSFTHVNRDDSDAIFAYLSSLPASPEANKSHQLKFPYNTQAALAVWRALYFTPSLRPSNLALPVGNETSSGMVDRGAYLVVGLGHCAQCHAQRDLLGGISQSGSPETMLSGGLIPMLNWYAPSLVSKHLNANVQTYLQTGKAAGLWASGPMAEVVYASTQYLNDADAKSIANYLSALPRVNANSQNLAVRSPEPSLSGAKIYGKHCEACHGAQGQGQDGAYPALAGNTAVLELSTASLIRMILEGGFGPSTSAHPRPYGMPPFAQLLSSYDIAAVLTHIRSAWGNAAGFVSEIEVLKYKN